MARRYMISLLIAFLAMTAAWIGFGRPVYERDQLRACLRELRTATRAEWERAGDSLAAIGRPVVDVLLADLREGELEERVDAATMLGYVGDRRATEPLATALRGDSADVAEAAAFALGRIGDSCGLAPLVAVLHTSRDYDLRNAAAEALGELGDRRAVEPLIGALHDSAYGEFGAAAHAVAERACRRSVVKALVRFDDPRAVAPLAELWRGDRTGIDPYVVPFLARHGDSGAWEFLLSEPLWGGTLGAVFSYTRDYGDNVAVLASVGGAVTDFLTAALQAPGFRKRFIAAGALVEGGDEHGIAAVIARVEAGDVVVALGTCRYLLENLRSEWVPTLLGVLAQFETEHMAYEFSRSTDPVLREAGMRARTTWELYARLPTALRHDAVMLYRSSPPDSSEIHPSQVVDMLRRLHMLDLVEGLPPGAVEEPTGDVESQLRESMAPLKLPADTTPDRDSTNAAGR